MSIRGRVISRKRFCRHCEDLHEVGRWPDNCKEDAWPRSDLPAPYLRSDTLPGGVNGMLNHADGRMYDSRHAYYKAVRAAGCEIVADDPSVNPEYLAERDAETIDQRKAHEQEIREAYIQARDTLTSDNISDEQMHNMLRAQVPAEEIIPNG